MKRSVLFLSLLLAAVPLAVSAQSYDSITTRSGRTFFDCTVVRVHPDGVAFTHRDGAAKIAFRDLPEGLRREFKYDPQAEAAYQRQQAALRKQEKARQRQREIAMEEQLEEAQMAEASYLASANAMANTRPVAPMSTALPGEPVQAVSYQSPSWVGASITGSAFGNGRYRRGYYSSWGSGYYPYGYGYGGGYGAGYGYGGYPYRYSYPTTGYTYPAYTYPSSGYPAYSYPSYTYPSYSYPTYSYPYGSGYGGGYYSRPTVYGSWNVGHGIRIGAGISPFGGGIRVFR